MTPLNEALLVTPRPLLLFIGRRRGMRYSSNLSKAGLLDRLAQALADPANVQAALASLGEAEQQVLTTLLAGAGRLARRYLSPRYGQIRPLRLLPKIARSGAGLLSPLERLLVLGLIFYDTSSGDCFIPAELLERVKEARAGGDAEQKGVPRPASSPPRFVASPADLLCHDLALLLGLLHRDDIRALHGRWLPPHALAAWGRRCLVAPAFPQARSELQTGRRRFLHYLAENGGLVSSPATSAGSQNLLVKGRRSAAGGQPSFLIPTLAAWQWLNAPHPERLQALWAAWLQADPDRWASFRLPGHDWLRHPARLIAAIHEELKAWGITGWEDRTMGQESPSRQPSILPPFHPSTFSQRLLLHQPHLLDLVPPTIPNPVELLAETTLELLTGPYVWLGVFEKDEGGGQTADAFHPSSPAPDSPPPAKFTLTVHAQPAPLDSTLTLTLAGGLPDPADLVTALAISDADHSNEHETSGQADRPSLPLPPTSRFASLLLTPSSFIRAVQRGASPPALLDALGRLADRPLTGQVVGLLRAWADAAHRVTLRPLTLLETTDPGVITRLAATRRGRALIQRTLSPRAVVVDPARLDQLIHRLTEQEGIPPFVPGSRGAEGQRENSAALPAAAAAHAWLALRVYQALGRLVRLPAPAPQILFDHLAGQADSASLAAAEIAAETVIAQLQDVIAGRAPFPPLDATGMPVEESQAIIKTALATGQILQMTYFSPGWDQLTQRRVEPHRLEQRSDTLYLIGFCHRAQAERVFRLDRIQAIALVGPEE